MVKNYLSFDNNIQFILIRAGYTDYDINKTMYIDKNFEQNYKWAKENNIKIGTFYESRATSIEDAKKEMNFYIKIIKNKEFEYPISVKLEDDHNTIIYYPESQETIEKEKLENILVYIHNYLYENNYMPLFITYESWYKIFKKYKYNFLLERSYDNKTIYLNIHNLSQKKYYFYKRISNFIKRKIWMLLSKVRKK